MKFSNTMTLTGLLATTAQACTRILINEVWQSSTERTREVTLWDQDTVSALNLPQGPNLAGGKNYFGADHYWVTLGNNNEGGTVVYPNGNSNALSQEARRQGTNAQGQTQVYYCLWDNYDCGNYQCSLP